MTRHPTPAAWLGLDLHWAYGSLLPALWRSTRCIHRAQDVLHDAFVRYALSGRHEGIAQPHAYLRVVARTVLADQMAHERRFVPLPELAGEAGAAQHPVARADEIALQEAFTAPSAEMLADLQQRLMGSLARHGVPPHLLELEVTESAAMTDPQQARELLGSLLAAGVCVVLDDFGTGYSSLAHLRDLPVSRVKIDRTFIGPMLDSPADAKIVKAVIALARTLGLQVVAEGVETAEQLRLLRILDCDAYQGWLFARAMPAEQIPALIHKPVATLLAQQEE